MNRFIKDMKRYFAYAKFAARADLKPEDCQLLSELAMVGTGSPAFYDGIYFYCYCCISKQCTIFSLVCFCWSYIVEFF